MKRALLLACLLLAPIPTGASPAPPGSDSTLTTVILVRHAEKNPHPPGGDAGLNAHGLLRARELARVLAGAEVSAIYASQYGRTQLTGAPLAEAISDSVRVYDANHLDALAARIRAEDHGRTVLVIGHGDTIGPTIEALTGQALGKPEPAPYDGMWVLTLREGGGFKLLRMKYGAKDEP
ncbi:MAG: phosphoglycerate mutase family protein [Candidatus Eisenbacteria bacterium]